MQPHVSYTKSVEELAKKHGIEFSVALDVDYLQGLIKRIIAAAKTYPELRDFPVLNKELETFLSKL